MNFRASNGPWQRSLFIYSVSLWLHNVCNVTFVVGGADHYRSKKRLQQRQRPENRNERWLNQITAIQIKNERLLLVIGHKMSWEPENHHHKKKALMPANTLQTVCMKMGEMHQMRNREHPLSHSAISAEVKNEY